MAVGCGMWIAAVCGHLQQPLVGVQALKVLVCASMSAILLAAHAWLNPHVSVEILWVTAWALSSLAWVAVVHLRPTAVLEAWMAAGAMKIGRLGGSRQHLA